MMWSEGAFVFMPQRAKRPCAQPGCSKLTTDGRCPEHRKHLHQQDRDRRGSSYQRGYGGKAWERTRLQVLTRDLFKCQACGTLVMGKGEAHVDHIVPKRDGGTDELDNLQTLCQSCHASKTASGQ